MKPLVIDIPSPVIDLQRQGIAAIGAEVLTHERANRLQVSVGPLGRAAQVDLGDGVSRVSRFDFAQPLPLTACGRAGDDDDDGGGRGNIRSPITCPVDAPPSDWGRVVRSSFAAHPPSGLRVDRLCFVHSPDGRREWSIRAKAGSEPGSAGNQDPETPADDCEVTLAPLDREGIFARVHAMVTGAAGSDPQTSRRRDASVAGTGFGPVGATSALGMRPTEIS